MQVIERDFQWQDWSEEKEHAKIIVPSSLADSVIDAFYGDEETKGAHFPWVKADERGLRIRPRELTIFAGINGHYKSLITSQIALHLMRQDEPVLIASFEMRPQQTMYRMTRQALGTLTPSTDYVRKFHNWTDDRLWIYDHLGTCLPHQVRAVCRYAAMKLGCKHVVIDSLMKCTQKTDDYSEQKLFIAGLCALELELGIHILLVAHARKSGAETDRIDKFSIRGAGEIADQADNVVLVQRNKLKKQEEDDLDQEDEPDVFVTWAKQRSGGFEGTFGFWFDEEALTVVEKSGGCWPRINLEG
jgi:twinkle protein